MRISTISVLAVAAFLAPAATSIAQDAADKSSGQSAQKRQFTAEQIAAWVEALDSDDYGAREQAMRQLREAGRAAVPRLVKAAQDAELERSWRAIKILGELLDTDDAEFRREVHQALLEVAEHGHAAAKRRAQAELASLLDPRLVSKIKEHVAAAAAAAAEDDKHAALFTDELIDVIQKTPGVEVRRGSNFQGFDWRTVTDPTDHPEVFAYRVKWFASGWSRWFLPGWNDTDTKTANERMWRYFMDHEYEYIVLSFTRGDYQTRMDFLPPPVEEGDGDDGGADDRDMGNDTNDANGRVGDGNGEDIIIGMAQTAEITTRIQQHD